MWLVTWNTQKCTQWWNGTIYSQSKSFFHVIPAEVWLTSTDFEFVPNEILLNFYCLNECTGNRSIHHSLYHELQGKRNSFFCVIECTWEDWMSIAKNKSALINGKPDLTQERSAWNGLYFGIFGESCCFIRQPLFPQITNTNVPEYTAQNYLK